MGDVAVCAFDVTPVDDPAQLLAFLAEAEEIELRLLQQNPSAFDSPAAVVRFSTNPPGTGVRADPTVDQLYAWLETDRLGAGTTRDEVAAEGGMIFDWTLDVGRDAPVAVEGFTHFRRRQRFELVSRRATVVTPAPDRIGEVDAGDLRVEATTTLAPGHEVVVQVRTPEAAGDGTVARATLTVAETGRPPNGLVRTRVDLSALEAGAGFVIEVLDSRGRELGRAAGSIASR
mgnify:CR=1 FL=1